MALLNINGRPKFFDCTDIKLEKVSAGRWSVTYDEGARTFTVVGGRESGGASHEWFCHHPEFFGDVWQPVNSMVAAIRLGVQH